ncbi:baseplate J/gp47 family protein [Brevibacillus laterosporus]|uniref:baseplate J/gp47 family protein n=1 Tax=Brevibacillus laterosporus TaxID=1465 RepID=UPI0014446A36|nr:baseplate J/gp47 family protein [Brevibacillus laterosporus]NKQ18440.1 baseplate J/gp47 family protein [Brevibacillus laterosporus]WNX33208.1 baseplate J/gp47 family protein [Brevibacillus laterosporus]
MKWTSESFLEFMLNNIRGDVDKREGSVIYDALSSVATAFIKIQTERETNENLYYADTATDEYLDRRTEEDGIERRLATKAKRKGVFYDQEGRLFDIPLQSRYSHEDLNFVALERLAAGEFLLECETSGSAGNTVFGSLIPIEYIEGLGKAEITDVLIPGADEEDNESLRKRYFDAQESKPFGGNIADYKEKVGNIPGVGGVQVTPAWKGGSTVKCTVIGSDYNPPSQKLVDDVQTFVDPVVNSGLGLGVAPIGHRVTIVGNKKQTIDLRTKLILEADMHPDQVKGEVEQVYSDYLLELRKAWKNTKKTVVRISQIESRFLSIAGVLDVMDSTLNGSSGNLELDTEEAPYMGAVTIV